ncbi:MAG TPA: hypothetical protein VF556_03250 [Pyrinomonadaceae bacterium]|jgi:fatty-acid desaturase
MNYFVFFLQIGELFQGNFNWRGLLHLVLFIVMGLIVVGFGVIVGYKAFQSERNKKDDR